MNITNVKKLIRYYSCPSLDILIVEEVHAHFSTDTEKDCPEAVTCRAVWVKLFAARILGR